MPLNKGGSRSSGQPYHFRGGTLGKLRVGDEQAPGVGTLRPHLGRHALGRGREDELHTIGRFTSKGHVTRGEPGVVHSWTASPVARLKRTALPASASSGL